MVCFLPCFPRALKGDCIILIFSIWIASEFELLEEAIGGCKVFEFIPSCFMVVVAIDSFDVASVEVNVETFPSDQCKCVTVISSDGER